MSKVTSKPKSRREYDQMKRDMMTGNKSATENNNSIMEKCKNLLKRKNSKS